ncbi:YdbC family protein [Fastidiosipila sanguinis]|uniref:Transcriptional coactivator p15 (PC4) C-terminal domain-containing protein n=1 Tax=Fastidiosipila sanguinis TaxID=236753 RepID=A0A2S0KM14_9FIRM|nr:PC4/YdbC family ssDNA-binding protein [Fastidiosipila sanguinis]AVM42066.1 hypothetical protein C5Q98_01935 [Fastidiosipila sanguinis]
MAEKKEFKFEIKKQLGVLSSGRSGWNREVNVVSWNDANPKIDIRDWSEDHSRMSKGISMTAEEIAVLLEILEEIDPYEEVGAL